MVPVPVDLDVNWICGGRSAGRSTAPLIQVHACDSHTYVLRQNMAVSYEAPFLYLLFGRDRALLLDTGATRDETRFPLRRVVDRLVEGQAHMDVGNAAAYELVVAHTHSHGDHVAGDPQFLNRPRTVVVGHEQAAVADFFHLADWPRGTGWSPLGTRPIPTTICD